MVNVKESRNRPGVAQRVPGGLGSQISWHSAREGGEVVSLTHRPPLPRGIFLVLIFTSGWVDPRAIFQSEGNMSLKNPVTPPGIDPGTLRLVAQGLNHYATPGPILRTVSDNFIEKLVKHSVTPSRCKLNELCSVSTKWFPNNKFLSHTDCIFKSTNMYGGRRIWRYSALDKYMQC